MFGELNEQSTVATANVQHFNLSVSSFGILFVPYFVTWSYFWVYSFENLTYRGVGVIRTGVIRTVGVIRTAFWAKIVKLKSKIREFQLLSLITENRERNSKIGFRFLLRPYTLSTYPNFQVKWLTVVLKKRKSKTPKIATLTPYNSD